MKVLTLWQPWATLVAIGAKKIETRSWQTMHRGPLLIHASARFPAEAKELCATEPFKSALGWNPALPLGMILCRVDLTNITTTNGMGTTSPIDATEFMFGDYGAGRFAWYLENVRLLAEPIPFKGRQGIGLIADDLLPQEVRA